MLNSIYKTIIVILTTLCFQHCASFTNVDFSLRPGTKPVSMTAQINREYVIVKHVVIQQKVPLLFLQRLNPQSGSADLNELLAPELKNSEADALVNVTIKGIAAFGDVMLPLGVGFFGGLLFPPFFVLMAVPMFEDLKTYTVEGDLVRYSDVPKQPENEKEKFDPLSGVSKEKRKILFDAETGLPIKE